VLVIFRTYRSVLAMPGAAAFSAAGLLARLPLSMLGIGIVLLVQDARGSYAVAGATAGAFVLTSALTAPALSRAVDRFGQARVMLPALAVHLLGMALLLLAAHAGAPSGVVLLIAVAAGSGVGSLGSLVRARWSYVLGRRERVDLLHTAYSLESVLDEVVFVSGPLLVTLLATRVSPTWAVLAAMVAAGTGGILLLLQHRTEPPPASGGRTSGPGVLRAPGMVVLVLAMTCVGTIFGSVEVVTVAYADELGRLGQAGAVLAVFAFGSLLAGVAYGSVQWRASSGRRFLLGVLLLAAGVSLILPADGLGQLAAVVFVAGFAISPMLISGNGVVQDLVPAPRLTEGLTWVSSAIMGGVSAGAALGGRAVDSLGAQDAFAVPVGAGLTAAVIVLLGSRRLLRGARADGRGGSSPAPA
jgi:MFS family permease